MRRKSKHSMPTRYTLMILTGLCLMVMFVSFTLNLSGGPLNSIAGYIFVPMQNGINEVGTWFVNRAKDLKTMRDVMQENKELQTQVDQLTQDLSTIKLEQYELNNLRELMELDQKYPSYDKVAARVIGNDGGNWFNTFLIDKGEKDGIEKDMNVIAGSGLVGIVIDTGPNYAKVRSIIDDASNVSGMALSSADRCIINGNLASMNKEQVIQFSDLKCGMRRIHMSACAAGVWNRRTGGRWKCFLPVCCIKRLCRCASVRRGCRRNRKLPARTERSCGGSLPCAGNCLLRSQAVIPSIVPRCAGAASV